MSAPRPVDTLVTGGRVVTVDEADTILVDGAVAIADGEIVAVGDSDEVGAVTAAATVVDAAGGLVLPGLVNAHTHLAMTLFRGVADDRDLEGFLTTVWEHEAAVVSPATVRLGATAGIVESLRAGVTTALDMYFHHEVVAPLADRLGFRLLTGPTLYEFPGAPGGHFDRLYGEAALWLTASRPGLALRRVVAAHSTYTLDADQLSRVRGLVEAHGALVHVHAAESRGEMAQVRDTYGTTPIAVLDDVGLLTADTVLAHAVHVDDADLARIVRAGAGVTHCPASNLKLTSGIARVPDLLAAGVSVGLGTDGPASSNDLDPWVAMRLAGLVHKVTADDPTVLPARDVVRMATIGGARALGIDAQVGSLEVGKRADVVVLDGAAIGLAPVYDAWSTLAYAAGRGDVRHVFVDGRHVVDEGRVSGVDVPDLVARLQAVADA